MVRTRRSSILAPITSLADSLTADLNETKFRFLHPKRVPWIQSPLVDQDQPQNGQPSQPLPPKDAQITVQSMNSDKCLHHHDHHKFHFGYDLREPRLRYGHESSTIQL